MSEHSHIMGGSTAAQRINCPGSLSLESALPKDDTPSEFAQRGSMLHAAMELVLTAGPTTVEEAEPLFDELEGQDLGFEGHSITRELIDTKLRPALEAWLRIVEAYGLVDWYVEVRVSLETIIPGAFGTSDVIARDKDRRLHVLDWKFGDGVPVDVAGNYGAAFYAAGALYDEDPELQEFTAPTVDSDHRAVVFHIVQPRAGVDADPLQSWETTVDWVEDFIDRAAEAADAAQRPDPPFKAGPWCRWCAAAGPTCPEQTGHVSQALGKQPESMDAVSLSKYLDMADALGPWIKKVYELGQREAEQGAAIPGYKLVRKRTNRAYRDEAAADKALTARRLKVDERYKPRQLITPTQLQKHFPNVYDAIAKDHVVTPPGDLTLVRDSDRRPAVTGTGQLLAAALPPKPEN